MPDRMSVEEIEREVEKHSARATIGLYSLRTVRELCKIIRQLLEERYEDSKRLDWLESFKKRVTQNICLRYSVGLHQWNCGENGGRTRGWHKGETAREALDAARKGEEL